MNTAVSRTLLTCFSLYVLVEYVAVSTEPSAVGNVTVAYNFIRASGSGGRSGRRVFGGAPAQLAELPSVCALANYARRVSCSGTLLNARWVLTAAHCVSPNVALVLYGTPNPELSSGAGGAADVHSQYRHPKYHVVQEWRGAGGWDVVQLQHDVGLVRTRQRVAAGDAVLLHALHLYDPETLVGSEIRVLGFGRTELGAPGERLMGAALRLARCSRPSYVHCLCARAPGRVARAVCAGDSGGPVLYRGALVGVTSLGPTECAELPGAAALSVVTVTRRYGDLIANTIRGSEPGMRRVYSAAALRVRPRALDVVAVFVMSKA